MKFKLDENLPVELGDLLREKGHDAHTVLDEHLGGCPDPLIVEVCQKENRILITLDLDFANIGNYPPNDYPGIIVLRLSSQSRNAVLAMVNRVVELLITEPIARRLWIVDEERTRIRGNS